jgi:hypothetical protein
LQKIDAADGSCNRTVAVPHEDKAGSTSCLDIFSISGDSIEDSDLRGVALPNDAAVLDHALCIIKDLRQGDEHNDPGLMMIVRNESLKTVLSLPFLAGFA